MEVDRVVSRGGTVAWAGHVMLAAEIPCGQVGIRLETPTTPTIFDLNTRELLRTRPNPLTGSLSRRLCGVRPPALGRAHKHRTVTIAVSATTLAIELDDQEVRVVRPNTTPPVRRHQGRPTVDGHLSL